jgi:hypothetical protein|uniref:Uncharacterized protein n=1 Tax=viral metagenome TaxID=1070528 RepID=A0A6C0BGX8_9ZZZZ
MNANYAAAVFGATLKIFDDMEDNPVLAQYSTPKLMELIKAFVIASLTYAAIYNMNFPIIIFIGDYLHCAMSDNTALSTDFYYAFMTISLLLSIITFDVDKLSVVLIISIIFFTLVAYVDHTLFPEEYSWKKIIWRAVSSIIYIILSQFTIFTPYYDIIFFYIGYLMLSAIMMTCAKYYETKSSKDPKELKEQPNEPKEPKEPKEEKEVHDVK